MYTMCVYGGVSAVAQELTERIQGTSVFLFGWADVPRQRGLAQRRKEMGWFKKTPDVQTDGRQRRFGLTGDICVICVRL